MVRPPAPHWPRELVGWGGEGRAEWGGGDREGGGGGAQESAEGFELRALLGCLWNSPMFGQLDRRWDLLDEVDVIVKAARERIAAFDPGLVILFSPDHFNGFFYDVMPSFCIGMVAHAIGDFGTLAGNLNVPQVLAEDCASFVLESGVDAAVSYDMQLDHGAAQPLEFFFGALNKCPVIPVFINSVAVPLPSFQRARLLGQVIGQWASTLNQRVLIIGSGGLSHQPPVPELATANSH